MAKQLAWEASNDLTRWATGFTNTSVLVQKMRNNRYNMTMFDTVSLNKTDYGTFATADLAKQAAQDLYDLYVEGL